MRLDGVTTAKAYGDAFVQRADRWSEEVPRIEDVRITSSVDGHEQPALWLPPSGRGPAPLLVVLHTWSTEYLQHINIPYAQWAEESGWGMIHPNFGGANDDPDATGSDLAVQDVIDAIDFAVDQGDIDDDKVFVVGFSGGAYQSLLMAGRHPDRIAGAVAWVPIHDLVTWYEHHVQTNPGVHYIEQIEQSCGGVPTVDERARASCERRSPIAHLDAARDAGVPVYIGHGLNDHLVPPSQAAAAFNQLARDGDRLDDDAVRAMGANDLPDELNATSEADAFFEAGDPEVLFATRSAAVTFVLFDGGHDMVYHPGLQWMVRLAESS